MSANPKDVTTLATPNGAAIGTWGDVMVLYQHGTYSPEAVQAMGTATARLLREHKEGLRVLTIVAPDAPTPDGDIRAGIAKHMSQNVYAMAVAYDVEGFRGAVVRGVITGLQLLARAKYPVRTFEKLADAAAWLETQRRGGAPDPSAFAEAVEAFRRKTY